MRSYWQVINAFKLHLSISILLRANAVRYECLSSIWRGCFGHMVIKDYVKLFSVMLDVESVNFENLRVFLCLPCSLCRVQLIQIRMKREYPHSSSCGH